MRNVLSKGLLAIALIASPALTLADSPTTTPASALQEYLERQLKQAGAVVEQRQAAVDDARHARDAIARELAKLQMGVRDRTSLVEVTSESVRQIISRLQEQREELELDRAGAKGRRQALENAVAKLSGTLHDRVKVDAVVATWQKVVEVRKTQLQRLEEMNKQGVAPRADVDAAQASLATAQAEAAAAQQKASGEAAGEPLDIWNRQILELDIADGERTARLDLINRRLQMFSEALPILNEMDEQRANLAAAENNITTCEQELRQARAREALLRGGGN